MGIHPFFLIKNSEEVLNPYLEASLLVNGGGQNE
jgi:hypothetical protein